MLDVFQRREKKISAFCICHEPSHAFMQSLLILLLLFHDNIFRRVAYYCTEKEICGCYIKSLNHDLHTKWNYDFFSCFLRLFMMILVLRFQCQQQVINKTEFVKQFFVFIFCCNLMEFCIFYVQYTLSYDCLIDRIFIYIA